MPLLLCNDRKSILYTKASHMKTDEEVVKEQLMICWQRAERSSYLFKHTEIVNHHKNAAAIVKREKNKFSTQH